ncbi:MAG: PAS domain-containing protein [Pseudomonadota bacterium]
MTEQVRAEGARGEPEIPDDLRALCEAFTALLNPIGEVVLHDWEAQTIRYIGGRLSNRAVGDPSLMDEVDLPENAGPVFGPYRKTNPDGRAIKSISVRLRGAADDAPLLLCLNIDTSRFEAAQLALSQFTSIAQDQRDNPLADDWVDALNGFVARWRMENGLTEAALSVPQRRALLTALMDRGAFDRPKAAEAVALATGVSRATIYNDLKGMAGAAERDLGERP